MPKKIKVVIKKVSKYQYNGKIYGPGDTLLIPERLFHADFMTKVVPDKTPKPMKEVTPKEAEAPLSEKSEDKSILDKVTEQ